MEEAMKEVNMVVEGVYSAKAAAKLAQKYEVPMPIVDEINKVLFEGKDPKQAVDDLMLRESKIRELFSSLGRIREQKRIKVIPPLSGCIHWYQQNKGGIFYGFI